MRKEDSFAAKLSFGQRLAARRKELEISQVDLAKRLEISRTTVGQWEISAAFPDLMQIRRLGKFLDVPAEWLAFGRTFDGA